MLQTIASLAQMWTFWETMSLVSGREHSQSKILLLSQIGLTGDLMKDATIRALELEVSDNIINFNNLIKKWQRQKTIWEAH